jgi:hypothetical protein
MGQQVRLRRLGQVLDEEDGADGENDAAHAGKNCHQVPSRDHAASPQQFRRASSPFITPLAWEESPMHRRGARFTNFTKA